MGDDVRERIAPVKLCSGGCKSCPTKRGSVQGKESVECEWPAAGRVTSLQPISIADICTFNFYLIKQNKNTLFAS